MSAHSRAQFLSVGRLTDAVLGRGTVPAPLRSRARHQRMIWIEVSFAIAVILLGLLSLNAPVQAQEAPASPMLVRPVYLPVLSSEATEVEPKQEACELNAQEQVIADYIANAEAQGRDQVHCNPILARAARARAADMATRGYFSHVDPDGHGSNYLVTAAGYKLPSWYDHRDEANNLESIGAGYSTADSVWSAWMSSKNHREHVLGLNSFYASQEELGVGFVADPNSAFGYYWVVITAPTPEE